MTADRQRTGACTGGGPATATAIVLCVVWSVCKLFQAIRKILLDVCAGSTLRCCIAPLEGPNEVENEWVFFPALSGGLSGTLVNSVTLGEGVPKEMQNELV